MAATGTESVSLEQLRTWSIEVDGKIENKVTEPSTSPTAGQVLSYNGESNVWVTPSEGTVYTGTAPIVVEGSVISATEATQSAAGTMSALDKTKLDGVEAGANKYVLPSASAGALGGITVVETDRPGNLVSITKGEANSFGVQYGNGLTKSGNAIAVENPVPDGGTAGQVLTKTADGTAWQTPAEGTVYTGTAPIVVADSAISIAAASTSSAGSMSAADKAKLDGIAAGANNYVLPAATVSKLGGIKVTQVTMLAVSEFDAGLVKLDDSSTAFVSPASETAYGTVIYASDDDFKEYMGIGA